MRTVEHQERELCSIAVFARNGHPANRHVNKSHCQILIAHVVKPARVCVAVNAVCVSIVYSARLDNLGKRWLHLLKNTACVCSHQPITYQR